MDTASNHGATVVIEGQYILDAFININISPNVDLNVALSLKSKTIPRNINFTNKKLFLYVIKYS